MTYRGDYRKHRYDGWRGDVRRPMTEATNTNATSKGMTSFGKRPINVTLKQQTTLRKGGKITLARLGTAFQVGGPKPED